MDINNILLFDTHQTMARDMDLTLLLSGSNMKVSYATDINELEQMITKIGPQMILVEAGMLSARDSWDDSDVPLYYYGYSQEEIEAAARYGLLTYGICPNAEVLIERLNSTKPYKARKAEVKKEISAKEEYVQEEPEKEPVKAEKKTEEIKQKEKKPETKGVNIMYNMNAGLAMLEDEEDDLYGAYDEDTDYEDEQADFVPEERPEEEVKIQPETKEEKRTRKMEIDQDIRKDVDGSRAGSGTKTVAVYSAKGGVGKTTISCELATYLALVTTGRKKLRVCIVDYNIDFGDVRSTLNIRDDGPNLTYWAAEVDELLEKTKPEDIYYGKKEIEEYMNIDPVSGLHVLAAPLTNADSAGISSRALEVIIDNIIANGEYDYVICDTGNNTRDSTMIAMTRSDLVLMIMTPNVNTANCDHGFLNSAEAAGYKLSNIKLVINQIVPYKVSHLTTNEIEENFKEYETVARIKFDFDVWKATNIGVPMALNPDHGFTKDMRSLVAYVMNTDDFSAEPAKKGLFSKLGRAISKNR